MGKEYNSLVQRQKHMYKVYINTAISLFLFKTHDRSVRFAKQSVISIATLVSDFAKLTMLTDAILFTSKAYVGKNVSLFEFK